MKTNKFDKLYNLIMEDVNRTEWLGQKEPIFPLEDQARYNEWKNYLFDQVIPQYKDKPNWQKYANDAIAAARNMFRFRTYKTQEQAKAWIRNYFDKAVEYYNSEKGLETLKGKDNYKNQTSQEVKEDDEYVDYDECFDAVQMTILENEGLKDKLRGALNKFFESPDEYLWENIFEGDGFAWLGLKDPRTFDQLGFKVGKEKRKILSQWTRDVDSGAFGDWDEYCDENAKTVFKNVGWGDLVTLAEKGWDEDEQV